MLDEFNVKMQQIEQEIIIISETMGRMNQTSNKSQIEKLQNELRQHLLQIWTHGVSLRSVFINPQYNDQYIRLNETKEKIQSIVVIGIAMLQQQLQKQFPSKQLSDDKRNEFLLKMRTYGMQAETRINEMQREAQKKQQNANKSQNNKSNSAIQQDSLQKQIEEIKYHCQKWQLLFQNVTNGMEGVVLPEKQCNDLIRLYDCFLQDTEDAQVYSELEDMYDLFDKFTFGVAQMDRLVSGMNSNTAAATNYQQLNLSQIQQQHQAQQQQDQNIFSFQRTRIMSLQENIDNHGSQQLVDEQVALFRMEASMNELGSNSLIDADLLNSSRLNFLIRNMECSYQKENQPCDYLPTNIGKEDAVQTQPGGLFPCHPMISEGVFDHLDLETLFYIFYFHKNTYEQYLAAQVLKKRTWRFHKKYCTWFKRLEAPRVANEEYEKGIYVFFDFEKGWCQRKKTDFTFKYNYLEDE